MCRSIAIRSSWSPVDRRDFARQYGRRLLLWSLVLTGALPIIGGSLGAQVGNGRAAPSAILRIRVVDSASGLPVEGLLLRVASQDIGRTDSLGWHRSEQPLTMRALVMRCQAKRALVGPVLHQQPMSLAPGLDTLVEVRVNASRCIEPPLDTIVGEFRGHYTLGFENARFSSCNGPPRNEAFYGNAGTTVQLVDQSLYQRLKWPKPSDPFSHYAYVRVRGRLIGPGQFGHMGSSSHVLEVDTVLEMRRARANDCRRAR